MSTCCSQSVHNACSTGLNPVAERHPGDGDNTMLSLNFLLSQYIPLRPFVINLLSNSEIKEIPEPKEKILSLRVQTSPSMGWKYTTS